MSDDKKTTEYLQKLRNLKLSDSARTRIAENLEQYADFHAVSTESVRMTETGRSSNQVGQTQTVIWQTALLTFNRRTMHVFAVLTLMIVGGGTSLAAQGSVPGEFLYPVKVGVNENVRAVLAVGADAEAELQADLLAERVEEAEELQATGRLSGKLAAEVESNIATQYEKAYLANAEADANAKTDTQLAVSLGRLASLSIDGNTDVAMNTKTMAFGSGEADEGSTMAMDAPARSGGGVSAESDMAITTELALEPISYAQLYAQTEARLEALKRLLERRRAQFEAVVYAELNTIVKDANALLVRAQTEARTEAEATVYVQEAASLLGDVEATLSLIGVVTIDPNTGFITDIDLTKKPATEPDRGELIDPMPMPLPMPPEVLPVDSAEELEAGLEATSQISL